MEMILFIGLQATGKSSFFQERFRDTHIRLNLDMLRTRHRERVLFEAMLVAKQPFVVDNTNPTIADRARYIGPAKAAHFRVVGYIFESTLADALARNQKRDGKARIPESGVYGVHGRLQVPAMSEGFDALYRVRIGKGGFEVEAWRDEV